MVMHETKEIMLSFEWYLKKKDLSAIFIVPLNQVPRTYFLGYNNLNVSLFSLARHGHRLT